MANIFFETIPDKIEYLDQCYGETGIRFTVTENVTVKWKYPNKSYEIVIPSGFTTDFASVPVLFRGLLSAVGGHNPVTLTHDYIYTYHNNITRKEADLLLRDGCIQKGINPIKAWIMWACVRIWGITHWN